MGDFYLDDLFYEHPKALAAGEDAANLFPRILAWAHRHNTGRIPKVAVGGLTKKRSAPLVASLVRVGLLHDSGECWEIHDWAVRNAKSSARREHAKKAAQARWSNAHADAPGMDRALREQCETMPNKPRNQGTKEQGAAAASEMFTHDPPESTPPAAAARPNWETLPARAFALIAERRIASANGSVANPDAYRASVLRALPDQHAERLAGVNLGEPGWTPERLADFLEPPPRPRFDTAGATTVDGRTFMPGTGWVS